MSGYERIIGAEFRSRKPEWGRSRESKVEGRGPGGGAAEAKNREPGVRRFIPGYSGLIKNRRIENQWVVKAVNTGEH